MQVPLMRIDRAGWSPEPGDDWRPARDVEAVVEALGAEPRKVFLAIGRTDVGAFKAAPQHSYVIRAVDAPDAGDLPPHAEVILKRGPFDLTAELELMRTHGIEIVVSKNSGGEAARPKIAAARQLGIPVIMIARPAKPAAETCADVASALRWLQAQLPSAHDTELSERGV